MDMSVDYNDGFIHSHTSHVNFRFYCSSFNNACRGINRLLTLIVTNVAFKP